MHANILYAADLAWWDCHQAEVLRSRFGGRCVTARCRAQEQSKIESRGLEGVDVVDKPGLGEIHSGGPGAGNSGHQAVNIAYYSGASHIILLGYDMQPRDRDLHFFGAHETLRNPTAARMEAWAAAMTRLAEEIDIPVINCSRQTALTCFPRMSIDDAIRATTADRAR